MISNSEEIKTAAQIVDIVGDFVNLKKKGVNYTACCPFHGERTPSFIVNPVRGTFKCFGCGKGGDSIEFLREHEAMTYPEALSYIAARYNIVVQNDQSAEQYTEAEKKRDGLFAVLKWATGHFSANLAKTPDAQDYLSKRKLAGAVNAFAIGYALPGNDLLTAAHRSGYSDSMLLDAGLIRKNEQGLYHDVFSRRIMFPFFDRSGRIIGFTGRILTSDKDKPKYVNSPETELFKKSRFLFGLYHSKGEIKKQNECILVEGQTDLISLHLAGVKNVVAGSGTALGEDQVKMILPLTNCLTVVYDGDKAGINASVSNIRIPIQMGLDVYVVVLPEGEDPDSFVRKNGAKAWADYIEDHRKDLITFRTDMVRVEIEKDPLMKMRLVKELVGQVATIPDELSRNFFIRDISKKLDVNLDDLSHHAKKNTPKPQPKADNGFFGLDAATDGIADKKLAILLPDPSTVVNRHAEGADNVISLNGSSISYDDVAMLMKLTNNVRIEGMINKVIDDDDKETPLTLTGKMLTEHGMSVEVLENGVRDISDDSEKNSTCHDFLDFYVGALSYKLAIQPDTKRAKKFIEMAAHFLSGLDNTIINIKTNEIAKKFNLTQTAFAKVLRPFVEKRKSIANQNQEKLVIEDEQYVFDIAHLPDYVDQAFFQRYGFFAAQNKSGNKLFYVFRTLDNTLVKVGNFYMQPLFQVADLDPQKNKRIIKLFHSELNKEEYVELRSSDMIELSQFKKSLWNIGGYIFSNGKPFHHEKILESVALQFPKCDELSVFGWQQEGFFAFSNGIISDNSFTPVDELGLVRFKSKTYYIPAFSVIFKDQRQDNDRYEYDRFLVYKPDQRTSWKEWADLMCKVYQYNNNGMWALLFTILAANRSYIFQIDRIFTALFFIGPTESGKSKIAESIRAPFMHGAPLFNLNSGTDAAFFTSMERFRDIPVIFEEYNDYQISDVKFQGLKAAVYDNEGKQKRKDASTKDIDVSHVNCAPILLGQEGPERDDGALGNRVVQMHVPKKDDWTDEEVSMLKDMKDREKDGLSNIVLEIYRRRNVVQSHFAGYMREFQKKVKEDIRNEGGTYQTRIINTVSLFIAIAKVWTEHVRELPLPFTFEEFYADAKRKIIRQSEDITNSNRLAVFFDTIGMLYAQGQIIDGREFDISIEQSITVQKSKTETDNVYWNGESRKVLCLIVNDVIQIYQKLHNAESLKINALKMYLKDHPSYFGQIKSHRFVYQVEQWETDPVSGVSRKISRKAERNTSCIALDYHLISAMGIDLERFKDIEKVQLNGKDNDHATGHNVSSGTQTTMEYSETSNHYDNEEALPF